MEWERTAKRAGWSDNSSRTKADMQTQMPRTTKMEKKRKVVGMVMSGSENRMSGCR